MYRQSEKNLLNSNILFTCSHNKVNLSISAGPLPAKIGLPVRGTPANFNGFRVLPSLLQRCRSLEANQTLHNIWPSPDLLCYIYNLGDSCPLTEFFPVQNSLYVEFFALSYCTALQQRASAKLCGVVQGMKLRNFRRGRHLYSAGRPSRWALAHIRIKRLQTGPDRSLVS